MALSDAGRAADGAGLLAGGRMAALGAHTGEALREWVAHNQDLAASAAAAALGDLESARRHTFVALGLALLLSGGLGLLTFRSIVGPIRALEASVESIVGGDFGVAVPFTHAVDKSLLARSIDVLRRGAATMEDQRWVKSNVATLTGNLQGAATLAEFGERLLSDLVPALSGESRPSTLSTPARRGCGGSPTTACRRRAWATSGPASATGSPASARAKAGRSTSRACLRTTCASPRASAGPRRPRRSPGRSRRATRCSRCSRSPPFARRLLVHSSFLFGVPWTQKLSKNNRVACACLSSRRASATSLP